MAPPVSTPENPLGMKGCQLLGLIAPNAPQTKIRMAAILISTITLFAPALSRTPRTRIQVRPAANQQRGNVERAAGELPGAAIMRVCDSSRQMKAEQVVKQVLK